MASICAKSYTEAVSEEDSSDEGEPKLQIVDNYVTNSTGCLVDSASKNKFYCNDANVASEAAESLLMLFRGDTTGNENIQNTYPIQQNEDYQDNSSTQSSYNRAPYLIKESIGSRKTHCYERMREMNNAASKRCRLKRRLKVVSLESQMDYLSQSNHMLRQRIARIERMSGILREGIGSIRPQECKCLQTVAFLKQTNDELRNEVNISTAQLLQMSKSYRDLKPEMLWPSSSDDDVSASTSPALQLQIPLPASIGYSDVTSLTMQASKSLIDTEQRPFDILDRKPKTMLDILNDTIVQTLSETTPSIFPTVKTEILPNFCVKGDETLPKFVVKTEIFPSVVKIEPTLRHPIQTTFSMSSLMPDQSLTVKTEPAEAQATDSGEGCVAFNMLGPCQGSKVNLNDLTSILNTITGQPISSTSGTSGMVANVSEKISAAEKDIIKSRIGIPFWVCDRFPSFICDAHRKSVIQTLNNQVCVLCGKNQVECRPDLDQAISYLITQEISYQNYCQNGKTLPIGRLVCGACKVKHFGGMEMSSSQIVMHKINLNSPTAETQKMSAHNNDPVQAVGSAKSPSKIALPKMNKLLSSPENKTKLARKTSASVLHVAPTVTVKRGGNGQLPQHVFPVKIRPSPPCFLTAKSNAKVQVAIQPVQKESHRPQIQSPTKTCTSTSKISRLSDGFNSRKIGKLNEALKEINPDYIPIGFSITSALSCSSATLQEAVRATETAVATLMSVIAPGQEAFLWEAIKPILDDRLVQQPRYQPDPNTSTSTPSTATTCNKM